MSIWAILILGIGVSLDAFAVSVSGAIADREHPLEHALIAGGTFGTFQALMPLAGFFLGSMVQQYIDQLDHWAAFLLLLLVGGKMIWEAITADEESSKEKTSPFGFPSILILAVATSLDAMAVGVSLALVNSPILLPVMVMGVSTFAFSALGVGIGSLLGQVPRAEKILTILGGLAIIGIGIKILLDHLLG